MAKAIFARIEAQPLRAILVLGLLLRILASCYSPGYLMHDDHFLVIETGASWAEGEDYNNWLPEGQKRNGIDSPSPHQANLAYPGIVSVFFRACHFVGLVQPSKQMVLLRLLHGIFSLLVVLLGYRIAFHIGGRKPAIWSGLALAAFGLFPILGVRQLVEVVCIPPLLWSAWTVLRSDPGYERQGHGLSQESGWAWRLPFAINAGFSGWDGSSPFSFMNPIAWRPSKPRCILGISALLTFAVGQLQDWWIWGEPFAQLQAYIRLQRRQCRRLSAGVLASIRLGRPRAVAPSFFHRVGVWNVQGLEEARPAGACHPWPFLLFHSYFPNRQERFILPAVPIFCHRRQRGLGSL